MRVPTTEEARVTQIIYLQQSGCAFRLFDRCRNQANRQTKCPLLDSLSRERAKLNREDRAGSVTLLENTNRVGVRHRTSHFRALDRRVIAVDRPAATLTSLGQPTGERFGRRTTRIRLATRAQEEIAPPLIV